MSILLDSSLNNRFKFMKSNSPLRLALAGLNIAVVIAALIAALIVYYATAYGPFEGIVYNADALYLPSLYADLSSGNSLSTWNLPPASYAFPDLLLYAAIKPFAPSLQGALVGYGMAQFLLFTLGVSCLAAQALPRSYGWARYSLVALMGVLFLLFNGRLAFYSQAIFISAHHFGVLLVMPFVLAILCKLVTDARPSRRLLLALGALSFLTSASDGLYLFQVTVPLVGSLGLLYLLRQVSKRRALFLVAALSLPSLAGPLMIAAAASRNSTARSYIFRPQLFPLSLLQLFRDFLEIGRQKPVHTLLVIGFLLLCAFVVARLLQQVAAKRSTVSSTISPTISPTVDPAVRPAVDPTVRPVDALLASYGLLSFVISFAMILGAGLYTNYHSFRYFLPFLIVPAFWAFPFVLKLPKRLDPAWLKWTVPLLALLVTLPSLSKLGGVQATRQALIDPYYPADIACIDEQSARLGLRDGVAQYWQARPLSMLSQHGLNVVQVNRDLSPYLWINNTAWYNIQPEFVVVDLTQPVDHPSRLDEALLVERFGQPDTTFECEESRVLVYTRAESELRTLFADVP